jgi:predicted PurR-regulated permease PerM
MAEASEPDPEGTAAKLDTQRVLSWSMMVVAVLALIYAAEAAREFLLPIVFAILLNFLLSPLVRALKRLKVPTPAGAGIVVLGMLGLFAFGIYELTGPVQRWAAAAPQTLAVAQQEIKELIVPLQRASRTAQNVASAASATATTDTSRAGPTEVVVQGPTFISRAFGTTRSIAAGTLEVLVLLYFLLAGGELFLQKLVKVLPNLTDKKKAVQIARETEASISSYLLTMFFVALGEAVVVTGVMHLWDMPNPLLWGILVLFFEFIPYIGALVLTILLALGAIVAFDDVTHTIGVPASYLLINLIQGNLISPLVLGNRLSLNPVALIIGLAFWFTIWGLPGAFMAVPIMAAFKILCDNVESLAAVGEFLGGRDEAERRTAVREV